MIKLMKRFWRCLKLIYSSEVIGADDQGCFEMTRHCKGKSVTVTHHCAANHKVYGYYWLESEEKAREVFS